jgi:predicted phage baseplate assembly protein
MKRTCASGCVCDCCLGITVRTPRTVANPPGLSALQYRVGEYGDFFGSMLARLGAQQVPPEETGGRAALLGRVVAGTGRPGDLRPLAALRTRATDDATIALLDAWGVALDVLTFYQERIANEGYLGTATEFRSVLELARLVGYDPRPGVAASTYLAYTLDPDQSVTIPAGSRAQSTPGANEVPQSFETKEDLAARTGWNALVPRRARPQQFRPGFTAPGRRVWFAGLGTLLKPNDPLLLLFDGAQGEPFRVKKVDPESAEQRTRVVLEAFRTEPAFVLDAEAVRAARRLLLDALLAIGESGVTKESTGLAAIAEQLQKLTGPARTTPEELMAALEDLLGGLLELQSQVAEPDAARAIVGAVLSLVTRAHGRLVINGLAKRAIDYPRRLPESPLTQFIRRYWVQFIGEGNTSAFALANALYRAAEEALTNGPEDPDKQRRVDEIHSLVYPLLLAATRQLIGLLFFSDQAGMDRDGRLATEGLDVLLRVNHELLEPSAEDVPGILSQAANELRRLQRLADHGVYPRVGPWLDEAVDRLEQLLNNLPLNPARVWRGEVATGPRSVFDLSLGGLNPQAVTAPRSPDRLFRKLPGLGKKYGGTQSFSDFAPRLVAALDPALGRAVYEAIASSAAARRQSFLGIHALRARSAPFGHNAPPKSVINSQGQVIGSREWPLGERPLVDPVRVEVGRAEIRVVVTAIGQPDFEHRFTGDDTVPHQGTGATLTVNVVRDAAHDVWTVTITGYVTRSVSVQRLNANSARVTIERGRDRTVDAGSHEEFVERGVACAVDFSGATDVVVLTGLQKTVIERNVLRLDAVFDQVAPGSYVVIERAAPRPAGFELPLVARVESVATLSHTEFGLTGTVTQLTLDQPWLAPSDKSLGDIRRVTVYLQSELLELAGEPYDADVGPKYPGDPTADRIELDQVYGGLPTGRWLVVAGERTDVSGTFGVKAAELVMLACTDQVVDAPRTGGQGRPHTILRLSAPMRYSFRRGRVTIYGNVVPADQGETLKEILGGGNGAAAGQRFTLKQAPLTHVAASVPAGVVDTLRVRVNDVLWDRAKRPGDLSPNDRRYLVRLDEDGRATVVFGDGVHGVRLPTGVNNVRAVYRFGMGRAGNVGPGRVDQLATRPLGVRAVTNPLAAAGGTDREPLDSARHNAPREVTALGRIVSVPDYADFALAFAGVAKTAATRLSDGQVARVHLTVAGPDGEPIGETSDLFHNLKLALRRAGDPAFPLTVQNLRPRLIALVARVRVLPAYEFETVVRQARQALFDQFSFDNRDFGQHVVLGELITTVQNTPGVEAVAVERFGLIDPAETLQQITNQLNQIATGPPRDDVLPVHLARRGPTGLQAAEIAFLTLRMPETLILNEAAL